MTRQKHTPQRKWERKSQTTHHPTTLHTIPYDTNPVTSDMDPSPRSTTPTTLVHPPRRRPVLRIPVYLPTQVNPRHLALHDFKPSKPKPYVRECSLTNRNI